jgi:hypothetical protein
MLAILSIIVRFTGTKASDRALRDIGLERSQIEAAVYGLVTVRSQGRR